VLVPHVHLDVVLQAHVDGQHIERVVGIKRVLSHANEGAFVELIPTAHLPDVEVRHWCPSYVDRSHRAVSKVVTELSLMDHLDVARCLGAVCSVRGCHVSVVWYDDF